MAKPEKDHASVGDALIFITKAVCALVVLSLLAAAVLGGVLWYDQSHYAELKQTRVELERAQAVRDLDNASLNDLRAELKERASKILTAFCLEDRDRIKDREYCRGLSELANWEWTPDDPLPPPGFVVNESE